MSGVFPLWGRDTRQLVADFVAAGFRAVLCCVEGAKLDESFVGRELDLALLDDLPSGVDPCGENGEYHSFVFAGPIFRRPLEVDLEERVTRDNRHYIDLVQASALDRELAADTIPPIR
jgi:diphthamide synthase (EF-2-diphthine--ammonia ligase)